MAVSRVEAPAKSSWSVLYTEATTVGSSVITPSSRLWLRLDVEKFCDTMNAMARSTKMTLAWM